MQPFNYFNGLIYRTKSKTIMRTTLILLFALTFAINGIAQDTETRNLSDFSEVSVGEAIRLTLVKGTRNEAKITSSNIDLDDIETKVSGDRLRIGIEGSHRGNINVSITLTFKEIDKLNISSAADVESQGVIKTDDLEVRVSSAGEANLELEVTNLDADVSSAGDLDVEGKASRLTVNVSSAGDYDGYDLVSDEAYVKVSSAGSASVHAGKKIEANANSGGTIKYRGNPEKVYVNSSSGGSVRKY